MKTRLCPVSVGKAECSQKKTPNRSSEDSTDERFDLLNVRIDFGPEVSLIQHIGHL